jgi:hypothetical protein
MNFSMDTSRKLGWRGFVRLGGMLFGNIQRPRKAQNRPSGSGGQGRILEHGNVDVLVLATWDNDSLGVSLLSVQIIKQEGW